MTIDISQRVVGLASDLVAIDTRARCASHAAVERCLAELDGFEIERIDFRDAAGVEKRAAVARRGRGPMLAFCGHVDTVEAVGWTREPHRPEVAGGVLHGLGAADAKGPLASAVVAAASTAAPVTLVVTCDEETDHAGAIAVKTRSRLLRQSPPSGIVVLEPTGLAPVRAHRATCVLTATATGVQAHTATGRGRSAVWDLVAFLARVDAIRRRLPDLVAPDPDFDPLVCDVNVVVAEGGEQLNVTAPTASARLAWRYSAPVDPAPFLDAVRAAAAQAGVALDVVTHGRPLRLAPDHPLVRLAERACGRTAGVQPYGTDATHLQDVAPCVVLGPGDISLAHTPGERIDTGALVDAVAVYGRMAAQAAAASGSEAA